MSSSRVQCHLIHTRKVQDQIPDKGDKPQDQVGEVHPDCILHACLTALVRCGMIVDVHFSKDAKEDGPEYATQHSVISKCPPRYL